MQLSNCLYTCVSETICGCFAFTLLEIKRSEEFIKVTLFNKRIYFVLK